MNTTITNTTLTEKELNLAIECAKRTRENTGPTFYILQEDFDRIEELASAERTTKDENDVRFRIMQGFLALQNDCEESYKSKEEEAIARHWYAFYSAYIEAWIFNRRKYLGLEPDEKLIESLDDIKQIITYCNGLVIVDEHTDDKPNDKPVIYGMVKEGIAPMIDRNITELAAKDYDGMKPILSPFFRLVCGMDYKEPTGLHKIVFDNAVKFETLVYEKCISRKNRSKIANNAKKAKMIKAQSNDEDEFDKENELSKYDVDCAMELICRKDDVTKRKLLSLFKENNKAFNMAVRELDLCSQYSFDGKNQTLEDLENEFTDRKATIRG